MTIDELVQTIDRRISDARAEAEQLEAAKASLVGPAVAVDGPAPGSTGGSTAAAPRRARARAAAPRERVVVPLPKLLTLVGEHPGETTSWLAKTSGADQGQLLALLKENEGTEVRREGARRATRWFRITDEDRVAARAAELASRSTAA